MAEKKKVRCQRCGDDFSPPHKSLEACFKHQRAKHYELFQERAQAKWHLQQAQEADASAQRNRTASVEEFDKAAAARKEAEKTLAEAKMRPLSDAELLSLGQLMTVYEGMTVPTPWGPRFGGSARDY